MTGSLVAGVDSSTQSTKVVLCRAEDGTVVAEASAPHPDGTECHPDHWWAALSQVRELLERADAVAVAAQQHGMVALDGAGDVVRRPCSGTTRARRPRPAPSSPSSAGRSRGRSGPAACRWRRSP